MTDAEASKSANKILFGVIWYLLKNILYNLIYNILSIYLISLVLKICDIIHM
jgi:hypothetical protein